MSCKPPQTYADPRSIAELEEPLRSRIAQLVRDAPTGGLVLISGRRSPWQQWILRNARCPGRECDPTCKGKPTTALPGKSNHQRGTAADLGGRELAWAGANEKRYGLHRPVPGEPWHFEAHGTPTARIAPWGSSPNAGRTWRPFAAGATDHSIYAAGGLDNEVSELQIRLKALAVAWKMPKLDPGAVDGGYGAKSQAAVRAFHRAVIRLQKATNQPVWPPDDANVGPRKIAMLRWWTP